MRFRLSGLFVLLPTTGAACPATRTRTGVCAATTGARRAAASSTSATTARTAASRTAAGSTSATTPRTAARRPPAASGTAGSAAAASTAAAGTTAGPSGCHICFSYLELRRLRGTFAPFCRAFESPIAMACLRFLTGCFPDRIWCISVRTSCCALRPYLRPRELRLELEREVDRCERELLDLRDDLCLVAMQYVKHAV